MELSLSQNISKLRKANHMTQEQLADVLGVTFASVSKWERGVATPELHLIMQMAALFGVSLDVLVGFDVHSNQITAIEERIHDLQRRKKYTDAMMEAEKALLRYPNDFRIVYRSGELYYLAGMETKNNHYLQRSIALLEHAVSLLSQNTDGTISEASLRSEIAHSYLLQGDIETGLEILKKYNVNGMYDPWIALIYTADAPNFDPKSTEPYMMSAFSHMIVSSTYTMMAYANYYMKMGNDTVSRESLIWLIELLQSIKIDPDAVAYMDKVTASCYAECANLSWKLGEVDKAKIYLHYAHQIAKAFDATPTYRMKNIKFCVGDIGKATAYDDLGESVMTAIERQLSNEKENEPLLSLWKQLSKETMEEVPSETGTT